MIFFYPEYKKITQRTINNIINKIDAIREVVASNQDIYFPLLYDTYLSHIDEASLKSDKNDNFELAITLYEDKGFSVVLLVTHSPGYFWNVEVCFRFAHTLNNYSIHSPSFGYNTYASSTKYNVSDIKDCFEYAKQYLKDMFDNAKKLLNSLEGKKTDLVLVENEYSPQDINNVLILLPILSKKWRHFTCSHEEKMVSDYYQEVSFFGLTHNYTRITMLLEEWGVPTELYPAIEALSIPWWVGVSTIHPTCPEKYIFLGPMLVENTLRFQVDDIAKHSTYSTKINVANKKITANEFANYYHDMCSKINSNTKIKPELLNKVNKAFGSGANEIGPIGGTFEKYVPINSRAILDDENIAMQAARIASKIWDLMVLPPLTYEEKAENEAINNIKLVDVYEAS